MKDNFIVNAICIRDFSLTSDTDFSDWRMFREGQKVRLMLDDYGIAIYDKVAKRFSDAFSFSDFAKNFRITGEVKKKL